MKVAVAAALASNVSMFKHQLVINNNDLAFIPPHMRFRSEVRPTTKRINAKQAWKKRGKTSKRRGTR